MSLNRSLPLTAFVLAMGSAHVLGEPLEELLVTGSYSPQSVITSSTSVLDGAQIRALNKRSLAGLLKTIPGVLVEQQGGPGGLTAVSIRGGEANFTLVLLDGVPVNDPTNTRGGGFDFANLSAALVERIEIVRGAASAIYGSDALAGVINVITRRAQTGHDQAVSFEWGEDGYSDLSGSALGRSGNFDYAVELYQRDDGDPVPTSERKSDSVNLRLGWQPNAQHALRFSYRYLEGERTSYPEQSGGPELAVTDDLDLADYEDQVFSLSWEMRLRDDWRSRVSMTRFDHEEDFLSPGIPPFFEVPPNGTQADFTRDSLQWVNTLAFAPGYQLDVGGDYRDESGESTGFVEFFGNRSPTDFDLDRSTVGVFANIWAEPVAGLLLNGSLRFDDPEGFEDDLTRKIGARADAGSGVVISANWGEAFKLPSFFALGHALVGNPDLQPEKAESWDAGIAWESAAGQRIAATYFFNDFIDLVDFDDATFRNVNRQNVETSGVELQARWPLNPHLMLEASGTYTDIDVKGEDTVLTGRPNWSAGMLVQWQVTPKWDTAVDYRYTGRQRAISRHTGEEQSELLEDYHRVDWVVRWQPAAHWQLEFSADNLFDERYETAVGFLAPTRAVRVGVRFSTQ